MNTILVVAAHPDDEVLGCGATLCKHRDAGDELHILTLTDGLGSRDKALPDGALSRRQQYKAVCERLGATMDYEQFPDNAMDTISLLSICKAVEWRIEKYGPDIIYTHHPGDLNIDHRLCAQAVMTACRPGSSTVKEILAFEVVSSTEWQIQDYQTFMPRLFFSVDGEQIQEKYEMMEIYEAESRRIPHPRNTWGIQHLASYRGMQSGSMFAEAFEPLRILRG